MTKKLTLLFALLPLMASAYDACVDGIYYILNSSAKKAIVTYGDNKYAGSVIIPETISYSGQTYNVSEIYGSSFYGCSDLTSVTIPNGVTRIADFAFCGCSGLTSIEIPNSVTSLCGSAFQNCTALTEVIIPNSIKVIEVSAFEGCSGLKSLTIPSSVTQIDYKAFYGCSSVMDIYCYAEDVPSTGSYVFNGIYNATLHVPEGSMASYKAVYPWNYFEKIVAIDEYEPVAESITINETNFPDENFRNWILSQEYGQDGVLTDDEIADVMSIRVNDKNIQSLKGIEYFTELEYLFCQGNQLKSLDLSKNTKLTYLNCGGNQLTSLDLSGCTAMTELWCFENQLTSLGISKCTALTKLFCYKNQLTSLDISACTALESMNCSSNQLTSLDVLRCSGLQLLNCSNNLLTSLDLSNNTVLESLQCYDNKLTSLNVTNTALVYIGCYRNQLNSTAMSAFVNGLPQITCGKEWDGLMYIVENENEGNVMTPTQVATATAKGWNPHYYDGKEWVPYADIKPVLRGDVNEDGVVNGTDIQEVINIIVNAD